jgi:hypothetical protein
MKPGRLEAANEFLAIWEPIDMTGLPGKGLGLLVLLLVAACQPTVKVEPPAEPITINLNIKLDAEVRVKLEEQAKEDISKNPDIF